MIGRCGRRPSAPGGGGGTAVCTRYHQRWERSGPGGSPGLQNQWRGARRGAVGSTPTRSRHGGSMPTERTRPPSVERVLTASRPLVPGATEPSALASVARDVIAEERGRLAAGEPAQSSTHSPRTSPAASRRSQIRSAAASLRSSTRPGSSCTRTSAALPGRGRPSKRRLERLRATRCSSSIATRATEGRGFAPPKRTSSR